MTHEKGAKNGRIIGVGVGVNGIVGILLTVSFRHKPPLNILTFHPNWACHISVDAICGPKSHLGNWFDDKTLLNCSLFIPLQRRY